MIDFYDSVVQNSKKTNTLGSNENLVKLKIIFHFIFDH